TDSIVTVRGLPRPIPVNGFVADCAALARVRSLAVTRCPAMVMLAEGLDFSSTSARSWAPSSVVTDSSALRSMSELPTDAAIAMMFSRALRLFEEMAKCHLDG